MLLENTLPKKLLYFVAVAVTGHAMTFFRNFLVVLEFLDSRH